MTSIIDGQVVDGNLDTGVRWLRRRLTRHIVMLQRFDTTNFATNGDFGLIQIIE